MAAPPVPAASAVAPEPVEGATSLAPGQPREVKATLTLLQANLLVAMPAGFWARKADGHPGPDIMGRGLLILNALVKWERTKKQREREKAPPKEACRKPG